MLFNQLTNTFNRLFNEQPTARFFAPGRVNLIGEHIDYNGGLVFPCAITNGTYGVVSKREDQVFSLYSENFEDLGVVQFNLSELHKTPQDGWTRYVKGILSVLLEKGYSIPFGLNMVIYGDLPNGAGLSSSASLEMLMCKIFDSFYSLNIKPTQMALIGKQVENDYIGVNSGIMDQFAIALGQENAALLLDCATQEYEYIPFNMQNYSLVIMNTNKRRELADSKYNERFSECQTILKLLQEKYPVHNLCELDASLLPILLSQPYNATLLKRLKHVVTENRRVKMATKCLANNDIINFGKLLIESHYSLKNDYEVTGIELDTLVDTALKSGAIGARMTGAGFGGCAIALVETTLADTLIEKVGAHYKEVIGYDASFYKATTSNGPSQIL